MAKFKRYVMVDEDQLLELLAKTEAREKAFKGSSYYQGFLAGQKQMAEWVLKGAALVETKEK
jgi:hypothetical protein